jgi:hypothetical protein
MLPLGATCEPADDQCVPASLCVDDTCRAFCVRSEGLCDRGICPRTLPLEPEHLVYKTCSPECDPHAPVCPSLTVCYLPMSANAETPGCLPPGTRLLDEPCESPNHCVAGLTCAAETLEAPIAYPTCRPICIIGQDDCAGSETCVERHAGDGYGICMP